jgi:DnaJ-class molecular chaperone
MKNAEEKVVDVTIMRRCGVCGGQTAPGPATKTCPPCEGKGTINIWSVKQKMHYQMHCRRCYALGKVPEETCAGCNGDRRVPVTIGLHIPSWAGHENNCVLSDGGNDPAHDGEDKGDIVVKVVADTTLNEDFVVCKHHLVFRVVVDPNEPEVTLRAPGFEERVDRSEVKTLHFPGHGMPKNKEKSSYGDVFVFVVAEDNDKIEHELLALHLPLPPDMANPPHCLVM